MKKNSLLSIYIGTFLTETLVVSGVLIFLLIKETTLSFVPPFYTRSLSSISSHLHTFNILKTNIRIICFLLLGSTIFGLIGQTILTDEIEDRIKVILSYIISSLICGFLLSPIVNNWVSGSFYILSGFAFGYLPVLLTFRQYKINLSKKNKEKFIRGAQLLDEKNKEKALMLLSKKEAKGDERGLKVWKDLRMPFHTENQHTLVVGSTGSGKTQIIYPIVDQIIKRGDKVIIWDVKGDYSQALLHRKNVRLLAPWDVRSMQWCLGKDVKNILDCQNLSYVFIPNDPKDRQPYFRNASREILYSVLVHLLAEQRQWSWKSLYNTLTQGRKNLSHSLAATDAGRRARTVIEASQRSSLDVYSSLYIHCQDIAWLSSAWGNQGESLRDWIRSDNNQTLILGGVPERKALAALTAKLVLLVLISEILSMPDDINRRVWLILDEFTSLGQSDIILDALSMGRSKGLCAVVGVQDFGRIELSYGREIAKSIVNSFNTSFLLRSTDPDTSLWVSRILGEQEVREHYSSTESTAKNSGSKNRHESQTESIQRKSLLLPSQISNFKTLNGVLRVPGWPSALLEWPYTKIPNSNELKIDAKWVPKIPKINRDFKKSLEIDDVEDFGLEEEPEIKNPEWDQSE